MFFWDFLFFPAPSVTSSMNGYSTQQATTIGVGAAGSIAQRVGQGLLPLTIGKASGLSQSNQQCVICQYLVERVRGEMLMNGIGGGIPFGNQKQMVGMPSFSPGVPGVPQTGAPVAPAAPAAGAAAAAGAAPAAPASTAAPGNGAPAFVEVEQFPERSHNQPQMNVMGRAVQGLDSFLGGAGAVQGASNVVRDMTFRSGAYRRMLRLDNMHMNRVPYPRRDLKLAMRHFRPPQIRYANMYDGPLRAAKRAEVRYVNNQMNSVIYEVLRDICAKHVPPAFTKYCYGILQNYQNIAQGLMFKDRPDAVCMHIGSCDAESYVRNAPHGTFSE